LVAVNRSSRGYFFRGDVMKRMVAALVLMFGLAQYKFAGAQDHSRYVLPSPKLLMCRSTDCSRLWPEQAEPGAVYPKQVTIDVKGDCIYGLTASYDTSVPIDEIKAAIDERYRQWAVNIHPNSPPYMWRVEPERFAIQLSPTVKQDAKKRLFEAGTSHVIYIAFGGESACVTP